MQNPTVRCGCGRQMALAPRHGRGAYRCGCGAMAHVDIPAPAPRARWQGCVAAEYGQWCQNEVTMAKPLRLCAEHYESSGLQQYHEWRFLKRREMSRLVVETEMEEWTGIKLSEIERPETIRAARARSEGRKPAEPKNGVVYFIQCGDFVKIGTTVNLAQRMSSLTFPEPPTVLLTVPGYREKETEFHRRFQHLRSRGEWFHLKDDLLEFIERERTEETA